MAIIVLHIMGFVQLALALLLIALSLWVWQDAKHDDEVAVLRKEPQTARVFTQGNLSIARWRIAVAIFHVMMGILTSVSRPFGAQLQTAFSGRIVLLLLVSFQTIVVYLDYRTREGMLKSMRAQALR